MIDSMQTKLRFINAIKHSVVGCLFSVFVASLSYAQTMAQYSTLPRSLDQGVAPLLMLAMSNDHQLYFKAYTDYDDLDKSGGLDLEETTYDNTQDYAGYFSNKHCYSYSGVDNAFSIAASANNHLCNGSTWSGNFLNWATMTRIDILRSILYGGYRDPATETASNTILERSYLPNDAHSFAKYYNKADINQLTPYTGEITICNTTKHTLGQLSVNNTNKPLMRIASGNYSFWASGERHQCLLQGEITRGDDGAVDYTSETLVAYRNDQGIDVDAVLQALNFNAEANSPTAVIADLQVRVEVCADNLFIEQQKNCTAYNNGYKPEGLLQKYGMTGDVEWALMTGGYSNNKTGGVLRKNFDDIADQINDNGIFEDGDTIFKILDSFRISHWKFAPNVDDTSYNLNCEWGSSRFLDNAEGALAATDRCSDWGNPIGEILAESYRYFAGAAAPTVDATLDNGHEAFGPAGVTVAPWVPVTQPEYACANMNVLGLNSGAQTFDSDIGDFREGIKGNPTLADITSRTNTVGTEQGVGGRYFVGNSDVTNNDACSVKELNDLSGAQGACPDAPRKEGSWNIAGLARFVSKLEADDNDINATLEGNQTIRTHGVQLSAALPQVSLGDGIVISPYCENRGRYGSGDHSVKNICALVDFRVISMAADRSSGTFYVNWEDSEQGGDFDQDMHGLITYGLAANNLGQTILEIKTEVIGQSTADRLGFGYVVSGAGADGIYIQSGINGFNSYGCIGRTGARVYEGNQDRGDHYTGCGINNDDGNPSEYPIGVIPPTTKALASPIEYAAKASCGKFVNNNDPGQLEQDLERVISTIGPTTPSGGGEAAATDGAGGLYLHTVYYAKRESSAAAECGATVTWVGQIGALFFDGQKRLREDTNLNKVLDGDDLIVKITSDTDADGNPIVLRYGIDEDEEQAVNATVDDINYIWSTTDTLNAKLPSERNIYTSQLKALPADGNTDLVSSTTADTVRFEEQAFTGDLSKLLTDEAPDKLISYIQGKEYPDHPKENPDDPVYRSRTLVEKTYLLGDILTSPVIQGVPDYTYWSEFNDGTYRDYQDFYKNKRKVVYVASNNGMIHALNAGAPSGNGFTAGAEGSFLGEELWSYIPFNLLPHLKWLADTNYQHVPYFDGYMRTFDIKAFTPDAVHVGGWGTVLVVGTGMGGGKYPVDLDGDDVVDITTRPAYVVLDITDRYASEPKVIAEISHEQLGFTTGEPDVIRVEEGGESGWYLVFGSGPRGYDQLTDRTAQLNYQIEDLPANNPLVVADATIEKPRLFTMKFNAGIAAGAAFAPPTLQTPTRITILDDNAFIGAINGMDWDRDFRDDAIYFGTVAGTQANPTGELVRAAVTFTGGELSLTSSVMFAAGKPIVSRPTTVINNKVYWVFAGTGRYFARSDADEVNSDNIYIGLKEDENVVVPNAALPTFTEATLVPTTGIRVSTQGDIANAPTVNNQALTHIDGLRAYIREDENINGWIRTFRPNERQHTITGYLASTLYVSTTIPSAAETSCDVNGDLGYVYLFDMRSGVYSPYVSKAHTASTDFSLNNNTKTVDEVILPIVIEGGGVDINDPANLIAVGSKSETIELPKLDFNIPSQRHSWREVTIPW
ncbi:pilus assembly protein [Marinagarivorans cellulosilyticus]|uniref:Type IV pilus assembly protein PilY1 n=1 Tax=Marinagarivorans cellulosilyticus TaxID=2721545 RepID=A0AAN1WKY9_9GAMM|nr:PilC/PilY family type IV pilus protein [Marinagarivorans cellulosilyticus]BCD99523.1 type IV pilus assembly protein PilY1 [Marinagarivorans cellulosilyticus]